MPNWTRLLILASGTVLTIAHELSKAPPPLPIRQVAAPHSAAPAYTTRSPQ